VKVGPYYKRQVWRGGRNVTEYVPAQQLEAVRQAIEGRERFEQLAGQFVEATVAMTRQGREGESKKNARKSARRSSRKPKPS
jgi:ribosomal protein S9